MLGTLHLFVFLHYTFRFLITQDYHSNKRFLQLVALIRRKLDTFMKLILSNFSAVTYAFDIIITIIFVGCRITSRVSSS